MVQNLTLTHMKLAHLRFRNTFVKNMTKYVILLHIYVSLLQKHKKHKNIRSSKIKKDLANTFIMRF